MEKAPCKVRGCRNTSQLLYTMKIDGRMVREPICYPCLKRITDERKDLQYKEFQLVYNSVLIR